MLSQIRPRRKSHWQPSMRVSNFLLSAGGIVLGVGLAVLTMAALYLAVYLVSRVL